MSRGLCVASRGRAVRFAHRAMLLRPLPSTLYALPAEPRHGH